MKRLLAIAAAAALFSLADCGGGGSSLPSGGGGGTATPTPTPAPGPTGTAHIVLSVPKATSSSRRRPRYVSSATQSASVTSSAGRVVVALSASNPSCASGSNGLTCTFDVQVPAGSTTVTIATYASTDGTGTPLSTTTMTVTITAGGTTNVPVVLNGVVASLTIAVSPSSFTSGQPNSATVTVNALDPAGKIIAGDGGYADAAGNPVSLALGDSDTSGATQLSATALTAPAGPVTLGYNGAPISSFTITASASSSGIAAVNATVTVSNGPNPGGTSAIFVGQQSGTSCTATTQERVAGYQLASGGGVGSYTGALIVPANAAVSGGPAPLGFITADRTGDLFVLAFPQSGAAILRYPQTATGSAMPSASIGGTGTRLAHATRIAADGSGGVWAAEPASAGRAAQLEHFAGGANGTNVTPDHTITGISGLPAGWAFDANGLAVDSHDNVYTTAQDTASSNRLAYALPAASNGTATPLASYAFVNFGAAAEGVAVNQHTDAVWVWPVDPRSLGGTVQPGSTAPAIAQFAANATAPSRGLWGRAFPVSSSVLGPSGTTWYLANAAFDAAGNVYVQYEASRSDNAACESRVSVLTPAQSGDTAPLQSTVYPAPATGQANQSIGIVIP